MSDWTASQIRELVKVEIDAERRLRDALRKEDRERLENYKATALRALELQAKEYERRLNDLNHAHAQAQAILATYLPREVYERAVNEIAKWRSETELEMAAYEARLKGVELGLVNLPGGIKSLELGLATQSGQRIGSQMTMSTAVTLIGTTIVVLGFFLGLLTYMTK